VESRQEEDPDTALDTSQEESIEYIEELSDTSKDAPRYIGLQSEDTNKLSENTSDAWKWSKEDMEKESENWKDVWLEKSEAKEELSRESLEHTEDISEEECAEYATRKSWKSNTWKDASENWEEDMEEDLDIWEETLEDKSLDKEKLSAESINA
jgi:hypothetical protein